MNFLCKYFQQNSYITSTFYKILRNFLHNKFSPKAQILTAPKDIRYLKLPYFGNESFKVRKKLNDILRSSFPQIDFRFIFTNNFTIGSYLKNSTPFPFDLRSSVVYLYTCPSCNARYVGSTSRSIKHRISDHLGRSICTNFPLSKPQYSAIREHSLNSDHPLSGAAFEILNSTPSRTDLLTLEALYIKKMIPELNCITAAIQCPGLMIQCPGFLIQCPGIYTRRQEKSLPKLLSPRLVMCACARHLRILRAPCGITPLRKSVP